MNFGFRWGRQLVKEKEILELDAELEAKYGLILIANERGDIRDDLRLLIGRLHILAKLPETRAMLKELLEEVLKEDEK